MGAVIELALKMKNVIQAKAKEKQATSTGGINPQLLQISEKAEPIHTDEELSKLAGVSRDTICSLVRNLKRLDFA
jgi:hypothetical protein